MVFLELLHIFTHMRVPDSSTHTHIHTLTASLSPVLHATLPSGPVISKRTRKTERCESAAWTLQSCLLLNLWCVCVCVWITFCLPACLLAQIVRRLVYLRACVHAFWQYPRLPRKRLSGDRPHAATLPRGVRMLFPPNKVMTSRLWFRLPAQNHTGYRADSSGPS